MSLYVSVALPSKERTDLMSLFRVVVDEWEPNGQRAARRRLHRFEYKLAKAHGLDPFRLDFAFGRSRVSATYRLSSAEERDVRGAARA